MKKIRVCINGITENDQIRGPVRYIYELASHIDTSKFDVILLAGKWQKNIYESLEKIVQVIYFDIGRGKLTRAMFFYFSIPRILREKGIDVYHIPDTNPPPLRSYGVKVVSTIHDMAEYVVPDRFGKARSLYRQFISKTQARRSDIIITVSDASKKDIEKYLQIPLDRIVVIHNGVTRLSSVASELSKYPGNKDYILYVGVLENAKNVDRLVEGYANLPQNIREKVDLKLAGREGNAYPRIMEIIKKYGLENNVHICGYMDDKGLDELYRQAFIFAYVSEHEGFGLPVLEAMQYGLPVLTANKTSLPEVAGNAALIVNTDVNSIIEGLVELISDDDLRSDLAKKGISRVAEFSWQKSAKQTQDVYTDIAGS